MIEGTTVLTRDELIARTKALLPSIKDRALEAEQIRHVPAATTAEIVDAGLLRVLNPLRYGGYQPLGAAFDASHEIEWLLGEACASTAWCYGQWIVHNWLMGHWPREAQEEILADPDVIIASSLPPGQAKAEPVPGGFRVSGRWEFSSGSDGSSWEMLGVPRQDGKPGYLRVMIPRPEYRILHDTWLVAGLCGTGSKDIIVEDAFVPSHRVMDPDLAGDGDYTGWELHRDPTYRMPSTLLTGWQLLCPMIGSLKAALDEMARRLAGTAGRGRTAESVALQLRFAEASAMLDVSKAMVRAGVAAVLAIAERGESFSALVRTRNKRDKVFIAHLCVKAIDELFTAAGGHALYTSNPMQRYHRDINAASHQGTIDWDAMMADYGRAALQAATAGRKK